MIKGRKWLILGLYIVAAAVLFTYVLFPSEVVKNYIAYKVNAADPNVTVAIESVKPSFPPGVKLKTVRLDRTGMRIADAQHLTIQPVYLSLLGDEKTYRFKGKVYDGTVEGTIRLNQAPNGNLMRVDARFNGIEVGQAKIIEALSGRKVSGKLTGEFDLTRKDHASLEAGASLELTEGKLELLVPVFTYKHVELRSVQADLAMTNESLAILRCEIKGQPADGSVNGTVDIETPLGKSVLNLEGAVKPHPVFMALLRKTLPASMLPETGANDGIGISFSGTLDAPEFAFN
jgi:type II secretion system protein N